jgi:hypothetical protein
MQILMGVLQPVRTKFRKNAAARKSDAVNLERVPFNSPRLGKGKVRIMGRLERVTGRRDADAFFYGRTIKKMLLSCTIICYFSFLQQT